MKKMKKNAEPEREDFEGEEEKKSLTEEDLQKGLDTLDAFVAAGDSDTRKEQLLEKALDSELSKAEKKELYGLMAAKKDDEEDEDEKKAEGADDEEDEDEEDEDEEDEDEEEEEHAPPARKSMRQVTRGLERNEGIQKALDVSDFLREEHGELVKSLGALADLQEQSSQRQHEFNLVLAKAVSDSGRAIQAMSRKLGVIVSAPAREPKGRIAGQPLTKSFGGQQADGELNKGQVLEGLDHLMQKSMAAGRNGMAECGEDLSLATAQFEQTSTLSPRIFAEVKSAMNGSR